ncbi:MAG: hypothetical protein AAGB02_07020 [Pseudomonadota bacterium]
MLVDRRTIVAGGLASSVFVPTGTQAQVQKVVSKVCRFVPHPAMKVGCFFISLVPVATYTGAKALVRRLGSYTVARCGPGTRCSKILENADNITDGLETSVDIGKLVFRQGSKGLKRIWEIVDGIDPGIVPIATSGAFSLGAYGERYLELLVKEEEKDKFSPAVFDGSSGIVEVLLQVENDTRNNASQVKPAIRLVGDYPNRSSASDSGPVTSIIESEALGPLVGFARNSNTSTRTHKFRIGHRGLPGPKRLVLDFGDFEIETDPFFLFDDQEIVRLNAHLQGV